MIHVQAHIVHYNSDLYATFAEAAAEKNGLTVLGAFIEVIHSFIIS